MPYKSKKKIAQYRAKWRELHPTYMRDYGRWLSAIDRHPDIAKPTPQPCRKIKGRVKISLAKVTQSLITTGHATNPRARRNAVAPRAETMAVNAGGLAGAHAVNRRPVGDLESPATTAGAVAGRVPAGG